MITGLFIETSSRRISSSIRPARSRFSIWVLRVNQADQVLPGAGSELDLTVSGSFVGTVDYMSPEQAYDPRLADIRSDVYSLGCTLHYLVTGKAPFGGETFMERLLGHRERPVPASGRRVATFPNRSMPHSRRSLRNRRLTGHRPWAP